MDVPALDRLLSGVRDGSVAPDDAVRQLQRLPFADLGFAKVDHHRALRQGLAEAVYSPGKTPRHCAGIVAELLSMPGEVPVLLTRATVEQAEAAMAKSPDGRCVPAEPGPEDLRTVSWRHAPPRSAAVTVVTAGTSDLPVAWECIATLTAYGFSPSLLADCGVAGIHRLLAEAPGIHEADTVIVIAGMEGALASIVGGMTAAPVVAVPTSTGYGAGLEGITALLAMHASCAAGVTVVGIDNGFGAACAVSRMLP